MHDQPLSGIHKFPPHEQHLYGAEKCNIKTALYLIDRIGRNSSEDPRGDAAKAAELIRLGFSIKPDSLPPQEIMEAERRWVDLTDDEIVSEFNKSKNNFDYACAVIAAFKEKNTCTSSN